jgi:hypothetical protein
MTRSHLLTIALVLAPSMAQAQDMPLSQILIDGEGWKKVDSPGQKPARSPIAGLVSGKNVVVHKTYSPDRSTVFYFPSGSRFLWAAQADTERNRATPGAPYATLRLDAGAAEIAVGGLATDRDGRIYVATPLGVQVFDPTGRLCGVLTPAAPGKPEHLAFEGDTLTLWIGEAKYARKLNTTGAK